MQPKEFAVHTYQWLYVTVFLICCGYAPSALTCETLVSGTTPVLIFPSKFNALDPENEYAFQLVQLILKKSEDKYGPCEAQSFGGDIPFNRLELYLLKNKYVHAMSLTVNHQRDQRLRAIEIPTAKGLIGLRVLLIRKGEQALFDGIKSIEQLRKFTAGQGENWVDANILERNNLPTTTSGNVSSLIDMLTHKRFDYFPRGALQLAPELKIYKDRPIDVEQKLILTYPLMTALYVNKNNHALAQRLDYGLRKAYSDGSFDRHFYSHPSTDEALKNLQIKSRTVIQLCNPFVPDWVPTDVDHYWLYPWPKTSQKKQCATTR